MPKKLIPWTETEEEILRVKYATADIRELSQELAGRSVYAIYTHAFKLGLSRDKLEPKVKPKKPRKTKVRPPKRLKLRRYEREIMRDFGERVGIVELKMLLPTRTIKEIRDIADQLGVSLKGE